MENLFKTLKTSRQLYLQILDKYSVAQLNKIPRGFNNNIAWNVGHIIVAQQFLIYKCAQQPMLIEETFFDKYKPGSKPEELITEEEINHFKEKLLLLVTQTELDFYNSKFINYVERITGTGFHLTSVEEALSYNNYHEGLHLGIIQSLAKLL